MPVNITGSSFDDLAKALNKVNSAAKRVQTRFDNIFNMDFTNSKVFNSFNSLNVKLAASNVRAKGLLDTLKQIKGLNVNVKMGAGPGSGSPGSGQSQAQTKPKSQGRPRIVTPGEALQDLSTGSWHRRLIAQTLFNFKTNLGLDPNGSGNPLFVSKFGNPGQMPLVSRFRVFQRPFPGSERSPFALGDAANVLNNAVYSAGRAAEGTFKLITSAGTDSVRMLAGFTQIGLAAATSVGSLIPAVGPIVGLLGKGLMTGLEMFSRSLTFLVDSMGKAIGGILNFATNLGLAVSGFAARAVQAASNLTELKNAAKIYVGGGANGLIGTAMDFQSNYGLSATDSLRLMTRVAGQLRQVSGGSGENASKLAIEVFKNVAEAGSVLNMNLDDMGKIIQSALAGRYTPSRRIGVAVSAPYLDMVAKQQGFDKNVKTPFEARAKAYAYELKRQTAPFVGDLQATQYEFANQQRKLLGLFESIFVQAGRVIEPFAKMLLIVSNDVLSKLNDKLRSFADGVENVADAMRTPSAGGSFGGALRAFSLAVARAADYVVYFAEKLYGNRGMIADVGQKIGEKLASATQDLIAFSLNMIGVAGQFIEGIASLLPTLKEFGMSLASMAEFIARQTGFESPAQKAANDLYKKDERFVSMVDKASRNKGEMAAPGRAKSNYDPRFTKAYGDAWERMKQVESGVPRSFVYGTKNTPGLGLGDKINDFSDKIRAITNTGDLKSLFNELVGVAPRTISDPLAKALATSDRIPNFVEPKPGASGQLVTYFDPARYRDEVQNRQTSAMEQTAQNTALMVELLKPDGLKGNVLNIPIMSFTTK